LAPTKQIYIVLYCICITTERCGSGPSCYEYSYMPNGTLQLNSLSVMHAHC